MRIMRRPQKSPGLSELKPDTDILNDSRSLELAREYNEKYLHWDKLQYYECGKYGRESLWYLMKTIRASTCRKVEIEGLSMTYNIPDRFLEPLHEIDLALSSDMFPIEGFDEKRKVTLSVSSMMEESIASSQMEGAVSTTKEAKRMLRNKTAPRNTSEKMILNNYRAMEFIRSNLDRELSPELIRELHGVITEDTLESREFEGEFRKDDSIAVRDVLTGETYYEPVPHEMIEPMIGDLCRFVNDDSEYIHPVIKGILIHFIMAFIHPFMDGNGRISRSLFYWYTMKKGYSVMGYLSISKEIREHKGGYEEAYQLSETDGNDVTYFIDYNLKMLMSAVDTFSGYLRKKIDERRRMRNLIDTDDLTQRQADIIVSLMNSDVPQDIYEISAKLGVSTQTVRNEMHALIEKGYVQESSKDGHRQRFAFAGKTGKG